MKRIQSNHRACRTRVTGTGFTLVEIVLVIALIGGIMALVVGNFDKVFTDNSKTLVKTKIESLKGEIRSHRFSHDQQYPQSLQVLSEDGSVPKDPWGEPYHYKVPGTHNPESFDLWSSGPDKTSGTADDIGNWSS